jgi:hypothetical protein
MADMVPTFEAVKKLTSGWIGAVRSSRQPLRGFLRMRTFLNAINDIPHAEERLKGASRSTHDIDAGPGSPPSTILSQPPCFGVPGYSFLAQKPSRQASWVKQGECEKEEVS